MMCLHRVGCGHMQNKAAGSTWVFFSSLNAWNIWRLIVGPHVQHPVCKRGWYAACLPQMLPPVCVFPKVLQGPEAIVVGGLPARLWAFQESTAAAAELTLWWKSERAAVFFFLLSGCYLWLLLSTCHLFLQEVLGRLQALLLDAVLCNKKETSLMHVHVDGWWGLNSMQQKKEERTSRETSKPQQGQIIFQITKNLL